MDRVHNVPAFKHFDGYARDTLEALCALILPEDHRPADRRVPLAPRIDELCEGQVEGFRFDDMPPNHVTWEWGLEGLDQSARATFDKHFVDLDRQQQVSILEEIRSTSSQFPDRLANSCGVVGKYLMAQAGPVAWGRFD